MTTNLGKKYKTEIFTLKTAKNWYFSMWSKKSNFYDIILNFLQIYPNRDISLGSPDPQ